MKRTVKYHSYYDLPSKILIKDFSKVSQSILYFTKGFFMAFTRPEELERITGHNLNRKSPIWGIMAKQGISPTLLEEKGYEGDHEQLGKIIKQARTVDRYHKAIKKNERLEPHEFGPYKAAPRIMKTVTSPEYTVERALVSTDHSVTPDAINRLQVVQNLNDATLNNFTIHDLRGKIKAVTQFLASHNISNAELKKMGFKGTVTEIFALERAMNNSNAMNSGPLTKREAERFNRQIEDCKRQYANNPERMQAEIAKIMQGRTPRGHVQKALDNSKAIAQMDPLSGMNECSKGINKAVAILINRHTVKLAERKIQHSKQLVRDTSGKQKQKKTGLILMLNDAPLLR